MKHVKRYKLEAELDDRVQLQYLQACALVQMIIIFDDVREAGEDSFAAAVERWTDRLCLLATLCICKSQTSPKLPCSPLSALKYSSTLYVLVLTSLPTSLR